MAVTRKSVVETTKSKPKEEVKAEPPQAPIEMPFMISQSNIEVPNDDFEDDDDLELLCNQVQAEQTKEQIKKEIKQMNKKIDMKLALIRAKKLQDKESDMLLKT